MHCRYVRVRAKCSKTAADWQMQFTQHVTNTIPNLYQYVVYPNGSNATDIANCENLQPGYYGGIVCIIIIIIITMLFCYTTACRSLIARTEHHTLLVIFINF